MMCCSLMHSLNCRNVMCGRVADDVLLADALRVVVVAVCGRVADDVLLDVWQSCG